VHSIIVHSIIPPTFLMQGPFQVGIRAVQRTTARDAESGSSAPSEALAALGRDVYGGASTTRGWPSGRERALRLMIQRPLVVFWS
jgi:hypothetical protein